jgi:hypothetical protein
MKTGYYATFDGAQPTGFFHEAVHGRRMISKVAYDVSDDLNQLMGRRYELVPNPDCTIPVEAVPITDEEYASYFPAEEGDA